jgi:hypothetical protein
VGSPGCTGGVQDHRCQTCRVQLGKQDLAFVAELDRVTLADGVPLSTVMGSSTAERTNTSETSNGQQTCGVYGEKAMLAVDQTAMMHTKVYGTFGDGSAAILKTMQVGLGRIVALYYR